MDHEQPHPAPSLAAHTPEAIAKSAAARTGRTATPEACANISAGRKRYADSLTPEERKVAFTTTLGRVASDEERARLSVSITAALATTEAKLNRSRANSRGNNPRAKPVEVLWNRYECIRDAVDATGMHKVRLKKHPTFRFL